MNLQLIKELCEKKKYYLNQLACDINMSETNLHRCIRTNNIQAVELEKISIILDVPVSVFFEGTPAEYSQNNIPVKAEEKTVEYMTKLMNEKDNVLKEKERYIQLLLKNEGKE